MYAIKTILAHPNRMQLRIMQEVIRAQNLKIDLLSEVTDIDSLYSDIMRHAPDLVILPDAFFTACINVITDKTDVICITENRSLVNAGNIRYAYVPVQPPELIHIVQSIYPNMEEEKMKERYVSRSSFLRSLRLPQKYCSAIDVYAQEKYRQNRNSSKGSLFVERRDIIDKIQSGTFQLERVREKFQGKAFEAAATYDPYAMRFVEDLGEIVPTHKRHEGALVPQKQLFEQQTDSDSTVPEPMPRTSVLFAEETEEDDLLDGNFPADPVAAPFTDKEPETKSQERSRKSPVAKLVWKVHPPKRVYRRGEPVDFTGGILTVFRMDGTSYDCPVQEEMVQQANTNTTGPTFATVIVKKNRLSESISVSDVSLERIYPTVEGRKDYHPGEIFDISGYSFSAVYSDGTEEPIAKVKSQRNPLKENQSFVMVSYGSASYAIPIRMLTKKIEKIYWASKPMKTEYTKGEPLDLSGAIFEACYRDGTKEQVQVTEGMLNKHSTKRYGSSRFLVNYQGMTLPFDITVRPASILEGNAAPATVSDNPAENKPTQEPGLEIEHRMDSDRQEDTTREKEETGVTNHHLEFLRAPRASYSAGERVQKSDILVKLVDQNGNFELVQDFSFEPDRPLNDSDTKLIVRYKDLDLSMNIEVVKKKVLAAVIKSMPRKLEYIRGTSELDLEGGMIAIFYSDGTNDSTPITKEMVEAFDGNAVGQQIVYICYEGQKVPLPIMIRDRVMVKVEVDQPPKKRDYVDGEILDLAGLSLSAVYDNGDKEAITDLDFPQQKVSYGQAVVQMNYRGFTFPVFVHVEKSRLIGIEVEKVPDKIVYLENREYLDVRGGFIAKLLSSGEKEVIPMDNQMVSGFSNQRVGTCKVYVTVESFQTSFDVEIKGKEAVELLLVQKPNKILYFEKEPFDPSGLELKARFDNNTFQTVRDYDYEPKVVERGTSGITVTFQTVSLVIPIQVQTRSVEAISIAKMPEKLRFREGLDKIDTTGGKLLVLYNNGSAETIDIQGEMICGFDNTIPGLADVTVLYENKETQYQIEIIPKALVGIAIQKQPNKTVYQESDVFDPAGMVLMGYYDNGSSGVLEHFAMKPDGPLKEGDNAVVISYADKMAIVPIQVTKKVILHMDMQDPVTEHPEYLSPPVYKEPEPVEKNPYATDNPVVMQQPEVDRYVEQTHVHGQEENAAFNKLQSEPPVQPPIQQTYTPEEDPEPVPEEKKEAPHFYASSLALRFKGNSSLFF